MVLLIGTLASVLAYSIKTSDIFILLLIGMILGNFGLLQFDSNFIVIVSIFAVIFLVFNSSLDFKLKEVTGERRDAGTYLTGNHNGRTFPSAEKAHFSTPGHWEDAKKSRWVDTSQKKRVWVEEKVVDGKVVEAHFEERLIPAGHWVEDEEKVWVEDTQARSASKP